MKAAPIQSSFNAGEWSDLMMGRVDFDKHRSAMKVCLNSFPAVQGPWMRRSGFYFCDEVKDSSLPTRVVRFKFSTGQAYALEFGHLYMRVKKNNAPVYDLTLTITGISAASPAVLTYTGTDPANGDQLDLSAVTGMPALAGLRVVVANVNAGANTFECKLLSGANLNTASGIYGTYTSGGEAKRVYTLVTPYESGDIFQLKFARSIDRIYVFHPDYPEASINRLFDHEWTHTPLVFVDGPYLPVNKTSTTLTPSAFAPGAGVTLTASSIVGINDGTGFQATDVGRYIRIKQSGVWGYCLITARTNTLIVTVTIINTLTSTAAKTDWRMGALSDTTGYSAAGTFYGDRFYLGGFPYRPNRADGSRVGDYLDFSETEVDGTVTDSHAVSYTFNAEDVQRILWMKGTSNGIAIGTLEGEWLFTPSQLGEAITPTNVNAKQSTPYGSANIDAVQVGTAILFAQFGARRVREMSYLYYENTLQSPDMTVLAEHVTRGSQRANSGVVEMAFQKERLPILWAPRVDGVLLGFTYSKEDKVMAWHRHKVGGWSDSGRTIPTVVESVCTIPSEDEAYDELWTVAQRYVNGRVVRYNEFLMNIWEKGDDQVDAFFVDSGLSYRGAAASVLYGFHHLVGETVNVLVNGGTHPPVVVAANGSITLTKTGTTVHGGYGYNSDGQALHPEAGAADGTAQGKIQRTHYCVIRLLDSGPMEVGPSFDKLKVLPARKSSHVTGVAPPLFTGDRGDFSWDGDYTTENYVCWRFSHPLPGVVLALMPQLNTEDR